MNKKIKFVIFPLCLLIFWLLMNTNKNFVDAATADMTLSITPGAFACTNTPTSFLFPSLSTQFYTQKTITGWNLRWSCTDLSWHYWWWSTTIQIATWLLAAAPWWWSYNIGSWNITATWTQTLATWNCSIWSSLASTWLYMARTIMNKTATTGSICQITGNFTLTINVPAGQSPWSYTWTLNINEMVTP